jgi:hypothetical protein
MSRRQGTRHSRAARRTGYLVTAGVDAALLYALLVWPGWEAVPFLTSDATEVLGVLTLSLLAGLALNLVYVAYDARWLGSLGDAVTAGIGLVVTVRVWQVFPFDFGSSSIDWGLAVRALLVVAMVGTAIGVVVGLIGVGRHAPADDPARSMRSTR